MTISVQLKRDVPDLGRAGQIVTVSQAHARNFLIPKGLAVIATAKVLAAAQQSAAKVATALEQGKAESAKLVTALSGAAIPLTGRASPQGKLFASIKKEHIIQAIEKNFHITLPPAARVEPEVLKTLGDHPVTLHLGPEKISFTVHLTHAET